MGINKFANNSSPEDKAFFHSSGYAETAHGTNLGVGSTQTFNQRHHMERNRSAVGRYRDSMVAGGPGEQEKESQIATNQPVSGRNTVRGESHYGSRGSITPATRPSFVEPPTRKYNPYA